METQIEHMQKNTPDLSTTPSESVVSPASIPESTEAGERTSSERRAISISTLPIDLQLKLSDKLDDEIHKTWTSWIDCLLASLPLLAMSALTVGLASAFFTPAAPFDNPVRWIGLLAGSSVLAVWLVWYKIASFRPITGEGIVLGETTLVLVRARSIEVFPAERLSFGRVRRFRRQQLLYDGNIIHRLSRKHSFYSRVEKIITQAKSSASARQDDRWRQVAAGAPVIGRHPSRTNILTLGAAFGVSLALCLEAGPIGLSGAEAIAELDREWQQAENEFVTHMDTLEKTVQNSFERRFSRATTSAELLPLLVESRQESVRDRIDNGWVERIETGYVTLATGELASINEVGAFRPYLHAANELALAESFALMVENRFIEIVKAEINKARSTSELIDIFDLSEKYGIDGGVKAPLQSRIAKLGRTELRRNRHPEAVFRIAEAASRFGDGHPFTSVATKAYLRMTRTVLRSSSSTSDGKELFGNLANGRWPGPVRNELLRYSISAWMKYKREAKDFQDLYGLLAEHQLTEQYGDAVLQRFNEQARKTRTAVALSPFTQVANELDLVMYEELTALYDQRLFDEAIRSMSAARKYLANADEHDSELVNQVEAWLSKSCQRRLKRLRRSGNHGFQRAVLEKLCIRTSGAIGYRTVAGDHNLTLTAANIIEEKLQRTAKKLGLSLSVDLQPHKYNRWGVVDISVTEIKGRTIPSSSYGFSLGSLWPCRAKAILYENDNATNKKFVFDGVCETRTRYGY